MTTKRGFLKAAALAAAGLAIGPGAFAADKPFPQGPVTIVVPFPAGGATDTLARVTAEMLARRWGQSVLVDNRPGAGSLIGAEAVARARPDGHTLMLTITSLVQAPHLQSASKVDPVKDFAPIVEMTTTSLIMVVNPDVPATTPAELVEEVRANPGKYSYGSYGAGSSGHLYGYIFNQQTGLDMVHVAYKGEAPSVNDLLGGQIPVVIMSGNGAVQHLKAGKMRALAVTGPRRAAILPDVPTFAELGYTGMADSGWFGLFAPAGTPAEVVNRIAGDVSEVLGDPGVRARIEPLGLTVTGHGPEAFTQTVARDYEKWGRVIREAGVKVD